MDLGSDPTDPDLGSDGIIDPALKFIERSGGITDPSLMFCLRFSEVIDPHLFFVNTEITPKTLVATHKRSVLVILQRSGL